MIARKKMHIKYTLNFDIVLSCIIGYLERGMAKFLKKGETTKTADLLQREELKFVTIYVVKQPFEDHNVISNVVIFTENIFENHAIAAKLEVTRGKEGNVGIVNSKSRHKNQEKTKRA